MIESLLALVPVYGLWLIFGTVAVSCLAVPLPSSALVLAAGGFAAAGDLEFWHVAASAFAGFALGDQVAYHIGLYRGRPLLERMRHRAGLARSIDRAERFLDHRGALAVFLSRTVLSPLGPYTTYLSGMGGLRWRVYTLAAVPGAALWALTYAAVGYGVADNLSQYTSLLWNGLGAVGATGLILGSAWWLRKAAARYRATALQETP